MITLYDIPTSTPNAPFSPNTWKTRYEQRLSLECHAPSGLKSSLCYARYCLNYKGLPYKTIWVEYPDIDRVCAGIGAPSSVKPNGKPGHTLPTIQDDSTGAVISDSFLIAEYLDKTYPDKPLFPARSRPLQAAFTSHFISSTIMPFRPFVMPAAGKLLNPPSEAYYRAMREETYGVKMEEITPKGEARVVEWKKFEDALTNVDKYIGEGRFMMGDTISFADFLIAALLMWGKVSFGTSSDEWKDMSRWNNGRWANLLQALEEYATVV
ncbi:hypothetical protein D9758_015416 [Tetrapyrgos nigripes]|uniref:GST N-terminal domain-containing protein n=1 Tax=Tetrapyrgos nigripes TaxID=182062 RepID=A0A8H5FN34_9AGAR|nr:hypothetical protein D9758_015416 [Tetrapyrgos nigripes]